MAIVRLLIDHGTAKWKHKGIATHFGQLNNSASCLRARWELRVSPDCVCLWHPHSARIVTTQQEKWTAAACVVFIRHVNYARSLHPGIPAAWLQPVSAWISLAVDWWSIRTRHGGHNCQQTAGKCDRKFRHITLLRLLILWSLLKRFPGNIQLFYDLNWRLKYEFYVISWVRFK